MRQNLRSAKRFTWFKRRNNRQNPLGYSTHHRRLACELLEDRRLLSIGGNPFNFFIIAGMANVAPTVSAGADATVSEGSSFSGSGSFTDPGDDTWTATVDYGDGSGVLPLTLNADKTFDLSHTYADNGGYTVVVTVTDDDSGFGNDTLLVTVNNVVPTVHAGADVTVHEGSSFSGSGSFTDPGADTWTATVDYGDGSGIQPLTLNADKTFNLSHVYTGTGQYTVTVRVEDDDNGIGNGTLVVTIDCLATLDVKLVAQGTTTEANGEVSTLPSNLGIVEDCQTASNSWRK